MSLTYPTLFEYGIQNEQSDIRAHLSVVNKTLYVFPTENGLKAIEKYKPQIRPAYQPGVDGPTADGWLVDIEWIEDLRPLGLQALPGWESFTEDLSTSEKGRRAVQYVRYVLRDGRFPLWIDNPLEPEEKEVQVEGTDVLVCCNKRIQVKCDYRAGKRPNGTGNLFLQRSERNPLKAY